MLTDDQSDSVRTAVHAALHQVYLRDQVSFSYARVLDAIRYHRLLSDLRLLTDTDIQLFVEAAIEAEVLRLEHLGQQPRFVEIDPVGGRRRWEGGRTSNSRETILKSVE